MKFKANNPAAVPTTPRQVTQMKYNRSRANLLLVILFTVVNLFSVTFGDTYFLFSANLPMLFPAVAAEIAADTEYLAGMGMTPEDGMIVIIVGLVIGLIMTVPYLLCWIFSKKRPGWMVAALVFFSIDCLVLIGLYDLTAVIFDLLIHAWVMFYLITGVKHGFKLKKMPEDEPLPSFQEVVAEADVAPEAVAVTEEEIREPVEAVADADAEIIEEANVEGTDEVVSEKEEPVTARSFDEIMSENEKSEL